MARRPRLELPGVPLHVIQRGNNRAACFVSDSDRHVYLRYLTAAARRHGCAVHAYVLMPNHVHLLATPTAAGALAAMMQDLGRRYVRVFNDVHARTGTLWEGRYKAAMVDTERYFLACQRYIELNPVRAGLVADPADFRWSSHRYYALGASNPLVTAHSLWGVLGDDDPARRAAYGCLFREALALDVIERLRSMTNRGLAIGSDAFIEQVELRLGRAARPPKRGRPAKEKGGSQGSGEMLI